MASNCVGCIDSGSERVDGGPLVNLGEHVSRVGRYASLSRRPIALQKLGDSVAGGPVYKMSSSRY